MQDSVHLTTAGDTTVPGDAPDAATWPDVRNRGLLQAAKQALAALEKHAKLPWGKEGYPTPNPGAMLIYEAASHLRPAIEREESYRAAVLATLDVKPGQLFAANKIVAEQWGVDELTPFIRLCDKPVWDALLKGAAKERSRPVDEPK